MNKMFFLYNSLVNGSGNFIVEKRSNFICPLLVSVDSLLFTNHFKLYVCKDRFLYKSQQRGSALDH